MSSLLAFYARIYAWISTAPVPLLVVLTCILLVTVPAAVNVVVGGVVGLVRGVLRLFGHDVRTHRTGPFRHPAYQLISLILLLSWAS
jgi:hypothetical protein